LTTFGFLTIFGLNTYLLIGNIFKLNNQKLKFSLYFEFNPKEAMVKFHGSNWKSNKLVIRNREVWNSGSPISQKFGKDFGVNGKGLEQKHTKNSEKTMSEKIGKRSFDESQIQENIEEL